MLRGLRVKPTQKNQKRDKTLATPLRLRVHPCLKPVHLLTSQLLQPMYCLWAQAALSRVSVTCVIESLGYSKGRMGSTPDFVLSPICTVIYGVIYSYRSACGLEKGNNGGPWPIFLFCNSGLGKMVLLVVGCVPWEQEPRLSYFF